jgi:UDP-glucuronate 4-epimerase
MEYRANSYEVFNLGAGRTVSLSETIRVMERVLNRKALLDARPDQPGDVPTTCADIRKARSLLGYNPATPFPEGIARFAEWLVSQEALPEQAVPSGIPAAAP